MPCLRQNAVSAGYDSTAPAAVRSSWTRTRFPLQESNSSRICCREGSAFSVRWISGTWVEFARRTLRTVRRDNFSTRAISRLLTPFALSSRIAVRCAWLSMFDFLFLSDSRRHTVQFPARAFDLTLRLLPPPLIHLRQRFGQPPAGATQNGQRHLQFALQSGRRWPGGRRLPLRFQKQFRFGQKALADQARAVPPGSIELPRLPRVAMVLNECGGHPRAVLHVDSRHRYQILHRQLRAQRSFAHLLLDAFRQQLHQRQSPRHPTHAAVEAARQLLPRVPKVSLHLRQQPALFQRAFRRAEAHRPVQQHSFGFAHRPDGGFDRVQAQLLQRRDTLVAIDHQIAVALVWGEDHDDRCLLATLSQGRYQVPLPARLADSQMFPLPVELVKLQLHRWPLGVQYGSSWDWSFVRQVEVCREVSSDQGAGSGLSRIGRSVKLCGAMFFDPSIWSLDMRTS